ncbi:hypothetical protein GQ43DRAFT_432442 [Delitschia confertaspora ATCC 74209]|uniref:Uncharacterized protein n=1 Tax=Delitschia confertaspora ATCC 74209 TaxID=1513339 RepID=A0A9P4MUV9_9PLEO|nr:hypothetical protein GQ43DRAFT_432442 [Delitschia confertaspora ATCC 74209]
MASYYGVPNTYLPVKTNRLQKPRPVSKGRSRATAPTVASLNRAKSLSKDGGNIPSLPQLQGRQPWQSPHQLTRSKSTPNLSQGRRRIHPNTEEIPSRNTSHSSSTGASQSTAHDDEIFVTQQRPRPQSLFFAYPSAPEPKENSPSSSIEYTTSAASVSHNTARITSVTNEYSRNLFRKPVGPSQYSSLPWPVKVAEEETGNNTIAIAQPSGADSEIRDYYKEYYNSSNYDSSQQHMYPFDEKYPLENQASLNGISEIMKDPQESGPREWVRLAAASESERRERRDRQAIPKSNASTLVPLSRASGPPALHPGHARFMTAQQQLLRNSRTLDPDRVDSLLENRLLHSQRNMPNDVNKSTERSNNHTDGEIKEHDMNSYGQLGFWKEESSSSEHRPDTSDDSFRSTRTSNEDPEQTLQASPLSIKEPRLTSEYTPTALSIKYPPMSPYPKPQQHHTLRSSPLGERFESGTLPPERQFHLTGPSQLQFDRTYSHRPRPTPEVPSTDQAVLSWEPPPPSSSMSRPNRQQYTLPESSPGPQPEVLTTDEAVRLLEPIEPWSGAVWSPPSRPKSLNLPAERVFPLATNSQPTASLPTPPQTRTRSKSVSSQRSLTSSKSTKSAKSTKSVPFTKQLPLKSALSSKSRHPHPAILNEHLKAIASLTAPASPPDHKMTPECEALLREQEKKLDEKLRRQRVAREREERLELYRQLSREKGRISGQGLNWPTANLSSSITSRSRRGVGYQDYYLSPVPMQRDILAPDSVSLSSAKGKPARRRKEERQVLKLERRGKCTQTEGEKLRKERVGKKRAKQEKRGWGCGLFDF